MIPMRVIFLDIDGVVNTLMISREPIGNSRGQIKRGEFYFDLCSPSDGRVSNTQAVLWLEKICRDNDCKIVLSSTWRHDYALAVNALYNSGLSRDIKFIGKTPYLGTERGEEIAAFLRGHPEITSFVILDDDRDMGELINHLVQTDVDAGINMGTVMAVAKKFEEQDKDNT